MTEAKLAANKQNAQLSTGPRTETGKAVVSLNGLKHGVLSKKLIIEKFGEDRSDYESILEEFRNDWQPEGITQHLLVEKMSVAVWRMRRVLRFETAVLNAQYDGYVEKNQQIIHKKYLGDYIREEKLDKEKRGVIEEARKEGLKQLEGLVFPNEATAMKISRYMTALDRELYRAMSALATLKQNRRQYAPCEFTKKVSRQDLPKNEELEAG